MDIENAKMHYENGKECLEIRKVLVGRTDIKAIINRAAEEMRAAGDYLDAAQLAEEYAKMALEAEEQEQEKLYQKAVKRIQNNANEEVHIKLAKEELKQIPDYKDAEEKIIECDRIISKLQKKAGIKKAISFMIVILIIGGCIGGIAYHENEIYQKKVKKQMEKQAETQMDTESDQEAASEAMTEK